MYYVHQPSPIVDTDYRCYLSNSSVVAVQILFMYPVSYRQLHYQLHLHLLKPFDGRLRSKAISSSSAQPSGPSNHRLRRRSRAGSFSSFCLSSLVAPVTNRAARALTLLHRYNADGLMDSGGIWALSTKQKGHWEAHQNLDTCTMIQALVESRVRS